MRTIFYGDLQVDYTDGEYARLQTIKQQHYDDPDWKPPAHTAGALTNDTQMNVVMPRALKERIAVYAKETGRSVAEVLRQAMEVLTS